MPNKFVAIFFANGCHKVPSKTVIFTRNGPKERWNDPPQEHPLQCFGEYSEVFRNAFLIKAKSVECLMVFRDEHCLTFKLEDMKQITKINYKEDVLSVLIQNYITEPDFKCNGSTWLMAFQTGSNVVTEQIAPNQYQGKTMQNTWVMRWKIESDCSIKPVESKAESIHFNKEAIQGALEYAPKKMILFARQEHLFIVHNWRVVMLIKDPDIRNISKYSITPFLGFNEETFPFVVTSGESSINIVNVKTMTMDVLVKCATSVLHAQTSVFFDKDEEGVTTMHFAHTANEDGITRQNWNQMQFM